MIALSYCRQGNINEQHTVKISQKAIKPCCRFKTNVTLNKWNIIALR